MRFLPDPSLPSSAQSFQILSSSSSLSTLTGINPRPPQQARTVPEHCTLVHTSATVPLWHCTLHNADSTGCDIVDVFVKAVRVRSHDQWLCVDPRGSLSGVSCQAIPTRTTSCLIGHTYRSRTTCLLDIRGNDDPMIMISGEKNLVRRKSHQTGF